MLIVSETTYMVAFDSVQDLHKVLLYFIRYNAEMGMIGFNGVINVKPRESANLFFRYV